MRNKSPYSVLAFALGTASILSACEGTVVINPDGKELKNSLSPYVGTPGGSPNPGSSPNPDTLPPANPNGETLSERYPGDNWDRNDPALIFATGFESGGYSDFDYVGSYTGDTYSVLANSSAANSGQHAFQMGFTLTGIRNRGAASIKLDKRFPLPASGTYYVRYYTRFEPGTARPHHGNNTRVHAPGADVGGQAGIRPAGDQRFNTTIDITPGGEHFFYTYWHEMRSGRCNDGSATPGCAGDQGWTYYYGNFLKSPNQTPVDIYRWNCYEYKMKVNTPNQYDGELALWINDDLVGEFKTGTPLGQWLRDNFYTEGQWGTSPTTPFEGFNFRTSTNVNQVRVTFETYQESGTLFNGRNDTPNKAENQVVLYDDIAISTQRIGCRVE